MDDISGKASSCVAIAEKRPQRPGGCVGIFFQLFDWNRRLAKKKLFSKKLLPQDRAKRLSKKFNGDEKRPMAKLLLIADENRGGFPTAKNCELDGIDAERNNEIQPAGLVARLMGLEYMPAVHKEKPKKPSFSDHFHRDSEDKSDNKFNSRTSELFSCDQEDVNVEKGRSKLESRPQKLQKTGLFDRRPVTRFGAEALQFKTVLSRPKKHHQNLASPVKSPRRPSGRNAARLMEAASKILEPGLQSTNWAKRALTYSSSLNFTPKDHITVEGTSFLSLDHSKHYPSAAKSMKEQFPCNSCGNLLDIADLKSNVEQQTPGFLSLTPEFSNRSQGSAINKPKVTPQSPEQKRDVLRNQNQPVPTTPAIGNMYTRRVNTMERKPPFSEVQGQRRSSSQQCRSQIPGQNQSLVPTDKIPPGSKYTNMQSRKHMSAGDGVNGTKNFVALNRNLCSRMQPRFHPKVLDNLKGDSRGYAYDKQDDSLLRLRTPLRKRRLTNGSGQVESIDIHSSNNGKQRTIRGNVNERKRVGLNACSVNQNHIKNELCGLDEGNANVGDKDTSIVSFMFSSSLKHRTGSSSPAHMKENNTDHNEFTGKGTLQKKKLLVANDGNTSSHKVEQSKGDALGALLEQKLRELTCQDGDERSISEKSSASILQELISALTSERTVSHDEDKSLVGFHKNSLCNINSYPSDYVSLHGEMLNSNRYFQADSKAVRFSVGLPLSGDGEHPSPLSVLEASFSNDSCLSDSFDSGSGCRTQQEPMDCLYDLPQTSDGDADLWDSATSFCRRSAGSEVVTNSICSISKILDGVGLADIGLEGNKLKHAREVLLSTELLFGNASPSDGKEDSIIGPIFLEDLEILFYDLSRSSNCRLSFMEAKEGNQLRKFLFDCMIECLDLEYGHCWKMGFKNWKKMMSEFWRENLRRKVYEEIRTQTDIAGWNRDEIIDREMSHSLGKWMHFEVEAFETGAEIEQYLLTLLINEMVIDLLPCRGSSF
ncbi:hypothetical protein NE237_019522 [Protea cynaroides]|uniref:DUF4378 domain-containing protein n=1 Tax=Protea cynaroides TaxID=273540 RepID=A0A9Q0K1R8_9MAGN|nr:hypothetical protein NE237_019522 [Protea cynaroides]